MSEGRPPVAFPWDPAPARPSRGRGAARARSGDRSGAGRRAGPEADASAGADPAPAGVRPTGWVPGRLLVRGPAAAVAALRRAAAGPGVVPWRLDHAVLEEDLFHRLALACAGTGRLSVEGCRVLAGQFRERAEARHARVLAAAGAGCALDLHRLLPVPPEVLSLGPDAAAARLWLREWWGTEALRRVEGQRPRGAAPAAGEAAWQVGFFAADRPPLAAVERLRPRWPSLELRLLDAEEAA